MRVWSLPVHAAVYLRGTVIASSPEIESIRSTTTALSVRRPILKSEIVAKVFCDQRFQAEVFTKAIHCWPCY
jgi:hypothetical protein